MVAMEANTCAGAREGSGLEPETSRWNNLVAEFADDFELPGMHNRMPTECKTMHHNKLEPGAMPPFRRQYQVSAAELVEVHKQIDT